MKRGLVLALLMAAGLAACGQPEIGEQAASEAVAPAADASAAAAPAPEDDLSASRAAYSPPVSIPMLAYRYQYRIEAPAKAINVLVSKHEAACQAAGPAVCQITEANVRQVSERNVTGTLSMRARPDWMAVFRGQLAGDAEGVGGKISTSNTGTDDLSASIVDTEAQIRAKEIAGDRLEDLLRRRTGKIEDLAAVESQLANMRGEIDSARSNLAMMKNRVRMSSITIDYGPKGSLAEDGAWRPVGEAVRASQGLAANVVAGIIMVGAGLAPLGLLGLGIFVLFRRFRKQSTTPVAAP